MGRATGQAASDDDPADAHNGFEGGIAISVSVRGVFGCPEISQESAVARVTGARTVLVVGESLVDHNVNRDVSLFKPCEIGSQGLAH